MATTTTNYNLNKPTVGGDTDAWGDLINTSMDTIDTQMKANADAVAGLGDPVTVAHGGTGATTESDARSALGLGTAATQSDSKYPHRANNLGDLNDAAAARLNLGAIGNNAAELTSGTLPDARLSSNIVRTFRAVNTGGGLTGGGNLSSNRTLSINVGVTAGTGMTGGGTLTQTRTLSLDLSGAGKIGTYALLRTASAFDVVAGSNYSGANLRFASVCKQVCESTAPAGTWRAMGAGTAAFIGDRVMTVFVRLS